ncbi:MAG: hypothetical protein ACI9KE_001301 [Polyangiales bacterium]|jgi:hypothetical protein
MNDELSSDSKDFLSLATSDGDVSPTDADRKRVRKGVGLALASAAGVAASAGSASAAAGSVAGLATGSLGLKAIMVIALVSGVVGVGALAVSAPEEADVTTSEVAPPSPARTGPPATIPEVAPNAPATPTLPVMDPADEAAPEEQRPEVQAPAPEPATARSSGTRSVVPTPHEESASTTSLSDELGLLRAAQRARIQGNFDEALRRLEEHNRRFPAGLLAAERDGTRVFVLCDASRGVEATRAQTAFLRDHSTSPLAHRVRSGCD